MSISPCFPAAPLDETDWRPAVLPSEMGGLVTASLPCSCHAAGMEPLVGACLGYSFAAELAEAPESSPVLAGAFQSMAGTPREKDPRMDDPAALNRIVLIELMVKIAGAFRTD